MSASATGGCDLSVGDGDVDHLWIAQDDSRGPHLLGLLDQPPLRGGKQHLPASIHPVRGKLRDEELWRKKARHIVFARHQKLGAGLLKCALGGHERSIAKVAKPDASAAGRIDAHLEAEEPAKHVVVDP